MVSWYERVRRLPTFLQMVWRSSPQDLIVVLTVRVAGGLVPFANLLITRDVVDLAGTVISTHRIAIAGIVHVFELLAAVKLAAVITSSLDSQFSFILVQKVSNFVTEEVMRRAALLPYETLAQGDVQDLLYFLRQETASRPTSIVQAFLSAVGESVTWTSIFLFLANWNWQWSLLIISGLVPLSIVQVEFGRRQYRLAQEVAPISRENFYITMLLTTAQYLREILAYAANAVLIQRHYDTFRRMYHMRKRLLSLRVFWTAVTSVIATLCVLFVQFQVVTSALAERLTIGSVTALFQAVGTLWTSTQTMVQFGSSIYRDLLFANKLSQFLSLDGNASMLELGPTMEVVDRAKLWSAMESTSVSGEAIFSPITSGYPESQCVERNNASTGLHYQDRSPARARVGLQLLHLSYAYQGREVLRDVSLTVPVGHCIGLTGENGTGKTTVCAIIQGLREPLSGKVLVNGRAVSAAERLILCSSLYQDFTRYELTYRENVAISCPDKMGAQEVSAFVSGLDSRSLLSNDENILERRLGTWFPDSLQLSGGQWQKLALYRALYRQASVYLLDEPTASLDPEAVKDATSMIRAQSRGSVVLIVSHDRKFLAQLCDEVFELANGSLSLVKTRHPERVSVRH